MKNENEIWVYKFILFGPIYSIQFFLLLLYIFFRLIMLPFISFLPSHYLHSFLSFFFFKFFSSLSPLLPLLLPSSFFLPLLHCLPLLPPSPSMTSFMTDHDHFCVLQVIPFFVVLYLYSCFFSTTTFFIFVGFCFEVFFNFFSSSSGFL